MKPHQSDVLWDVILEIVALLEDVGIPYQIDSSTTLFVHGIGVPIKDVDICVQFEHFEGLHGLLETYSPTPILVKGQWHQFHIHPRGVDVHFLTTARMVDLSSNPDRVRVRYDGVSFWSLSVSWCRRHMADDDDRAVIVDQFLSDHGRQGER